MPPLSAISSIQEDASLAGERRSPLGLPASLPAIVLRCAACRKDGVACSYESLAANQHPFICSVCSFTTKQLAGIWSALPSVRQRYFGRFIEEYEHVRKQEGRGTTSPEFYLELPFRDLTGRNGWQWSIRSRTFRYIARNILPMLSGTAFSGTLSKKRGTALKILDLGAGNGWMSYRLGCLGHQPIAVDLLTNPLDGLGAAVHYKSALRTFFPRFQAELDNLPFADGQFDCAIFNASFHYSENYERTLAETIRCVSRGGTIIIADTPTYSEESSGQQMLEERQQTFEKNFGVKSDSLKSGEYLTPARLLALEAKLELEWRVHRVWYGFRWAMRPLRSRLKNRREPSQFRIYVTQVKHQ
jgi:SAM-dependent methyltransferase